jgi:hypothetical protein
VTYKAEIRRRYPTRDDAWAYLASRGFVCYSDGWRNGRWAATVARDGDAIAVTVWLTGGLPATRAA